MVKVYKQKDRFIIYIPTDLADTMKLKENDDVDFYRYSDSAFLFARKADLAAIMARIRQEKKAAGGVVVEDRKAALSQDEKRVLRKLEGIRYQDRTVESVGKALTKDERTVLAQLIKNKHVWLYKDKGGRGLYSISKYVYVKPSAEVTDAEGQPGRDAREGAREMPRPPIAAAERKIVNLARPGLEDDNVKALEEKGYVVIPTEGEAASASLALEESIRRGIVIGTRGFNKKYYIILRAFFSQYSGKIIKSLGSGNARKVSDIARDAGIEEDGARTILYLLSESGEVSEKKRDVFTLA